jgi:hypothetical protein
MPVVLNENRLTSWMGGGLEDGNLHRGNLSVRDGLVCSYRAPIAARMGKSASNSDGALKPLVAIDTRRYSNTTSGHQSALQYALYRQHPRPVLLSTSLDMWREAGIADFTQVDLYDTFGNIEYAPYSGVNYALLNDGRRSLLHGQERIKGRDWQYFLIEVRTWATSIADAMQFILPQTVKNLISAREREARSEARGEGKWPPMYPDLTGGLLRQGDLWFLETTRSTHDLLDGPWNNLDRLRDLSALNLDFYDTDLPYMSRRVADEVLSTSWGAQRPLIVADPPGWSHQPTDLRRSPGLSGWFARGVVRHPQHPTLKLGDGKKWWRIETSPARAWSSGSRGSSGTRHD